MNTIRTCLIASVFVFTITFASAQQPLTWTNVVFLNVSGNNLEKRGDVRTEWNAGAISQEKFYGDGWVEFKFLVPKYAMMGLGPYNTSVNVSTIHYAIHAHINGYINIYEKGVRLPNVGKGLAIHVAYTANDIFRVERKNGVVYYKKNGNVFYTSTIPSNGPLHIDSSFYQALSAISVSNYMLGLIWTGAQNEDWNEPGNWNLNRVPTAGDQVTINSCSTCPKLENGVTVSALLLNSGSKIDLGNHTLSVGTVSSLSGGNIESAEGKIAAADFIEIKNCSFKGSIVLEKTGGVANACYGGNLFSPELKILNSSGQAWEIASQANNEVKQF
jgi:hypothetical protein